MCSSLPHPLHRPLWNHVEYSDHNSQTHDTHIVERSCQKPASTVFSAITEPITQSVLSRKLLLTKARHRIVVQTIQIAFESVISWEDSVFGAVAPVVFEIVIRIRCIDVDQRANEHQYKRDHIDWQTLNETMDWGTSKVLPKNQTGLWRFDDLRYHLHKLLFSVLAQLLNFHDNLLVLLWSAHRT